MAIVENTDEHGYIIEHVELIKDLLASLMKREEEISALRYALSRAEADKQELRNKLENL